MQGRPSTRLTRRPRDGYCSRSVAAHATTTGGQAQAQGRRETPMAVARDQQDERDDGRAGAARALELPPARRDEWRSLRPADQAILTGEVLARWTAALAPDEYSLAEVVGLERQRRQSLATIREGVALTDQEFQLVRLLQRHEGRTVTFAEMIRELWPADARGAKERELWRHGGTFERHVRSVHVLIWKLKRKLELDHLRPQHLVNMRSIGYRWYSLPPSVDDGEDYAARADEGRALRYEIRAHRG